MLEDCTGHEAWLDVVNRDNWRLWPRLRDYLRDRERLPVNVLAELDQPEEAIISYRQALAVDAGLADARFNLAQTLVELGRSDEAVLHWRAYLAADRESTWADYARERMESVRCSGAG